MGGMEGGGVRGGASFAAAPVGNGSVTYAYGLGLVLVTPRYFRARAGGGGLWWWQTPRKQGY